MTDKNKGYTVLWYKFYNSTVSHTFNPCNIICRATWRRSVTCEVHSMLRDISFLVLLFFYSGFLCLVLV